MCLCACVVIMPGCHHTGSTCVSVCMCCDNASGVHVVIIQAVPVCLCACVVIMPVVCMSSSYRQYLCVCVHVL